MFKKRVINFEGNPEHYVVKHEFSGFKRNQMVEVPKGYEAVLIEADGTTEIMKNQYAFKLNAPCQYIFYVKSNRKVIKTNWGTASRMQAKNFKGNIVTVGGYGTIEFRMMNPVRLINYRLNNDAYIDEELLIEILLSKLPEALHQAMGEITPIDDEDISKVEKQLKEQTLQSIGYAASLMGLEVVDFVVEHLNVQQMD